MVQGALSGSGSPAYGKYCRQRGRVAELPRALSAPNGHLERHLPARPRRKDVRVAQGPWGRRPGDGQAAWLSGPVVPLREGTVRGIAVGMRTLTSPTPCFCLWLWPVHTARGPRFSP